MLTAPQDPVSHRKEHLLLAKLLVVQCVPTHAFSLHPGKDPNGLGSEKFYTSPQLSSYIRGEIFIAYWPDLHL